MQCSDMQIFIFMNINENNRNKRKIVKNKGVHMQIYLHVSCFYPIITDLVPI